MADFTQAEAALAPRYTTLVAASIATLLLVRLIVSSEVPLAFDEALYWRWSQHLALGNLDHPPMTPLLIRAGTFFFGATPFGVRVMTILLDIPATLAVWRGAAILFGSERIGATAALFFNLTLAVAVASMLATPDFPVVTCAAILLALLAKLSRSNRGEWWLAIGVAFGAGMFSKYSMIFFAPSILVWLLLFPKQRRWLWTPWPWLGGVTALAVFSPVLIWNAEHGWASVLYQSRRLVVHQLSLSYLAEYPLTQFGLLTPSIFILGLLAILRTFNAPARELSARVLIAALILPTAGYFLWHSLHGRVEGNWPMPIFPAVSIAAAVTAEGDAWKGRLATLAFWSRRLAMPVAIAIAALIYGQALFGLLPFGHLDPTARALGVGWPQLAAQIDDIRRKTNAPVILTADYGVASWLSFYLPSSIPVEQVNNRMRWVNEPTPDPVLFQGPMIFVCQGIQCNNHHWLENRFRNITLISTINRMRGGVPVTPYGIFRVASPTGPVLDPLDDGGSK